MKTQHMVFDLKTGETRIETVDVDTTDPTEMMKQLLHDCPECRAAMERGETPRIIAGEELQERVRRAHGGRWRKANWRR